MSSYWGLHTAADDSPILYRGVGLLREQLSPELADRLDHALGGGHNPELPGHLLDHLSRQGRGVGAFWSEQPHLAEWYSKYTMGSPAGSRWQPADYHVMMTSSGIPDDARQEMVGGMPIHVVRQRTPMQINLLNIRRARPHDLNNPVSYTYDNEFDDSGWVPLGGDPTDGIRYAQVVEADVADDLYRLAMPSQDAYDYAIMDSKRNTDNIPEQGSFYHGSNHEHQPGDILESVRARGDQDRLDYYQQSVGAPNHADWVWMYNHPAPATKYHKNVYQLEPLDEGPWVWNNIKRDDGSFRPTENDEDFPRLVSPRARVVRKLSPNEYAAAGKHLSDLYEKYRADSRTKTAMPAPLPQGIHFAPFQRGDNTSRLIQNTYPDITWEPGPGIAAHLPGHNAPVGHIEWLSDDDADEAEQYGEPTINPGEVAYINVDDALRRHSIGTALFDHAQAHEPRVHHSQDRTELGEKWIGHEQSRHPVMARRIAMPAIDAYDDHIKTQYRDAEQSVKPGPYFHATDQLLKPGDSILPLRDVQNKIPTAQGRQQNYSDMGYENHANWVWMMRHPAEVSNYGKYVYHVQPEVEGPWSWNNAAHYDGDDYSNHRYVSPRARVIQQIHPDEYGYYPLPDTDDDEQHTAARIAMPAPLPKGVFFRYHPELMWSPGVTAHAPGGKQIGSLEWYDDDHVMVDLGTRQPGEIDRIGVHPDYQGQSVATSMFDFAKQHEPRLHHSTELTDDGRGWSEYEKSRNARLAMAWQDWAPQIQGGCKSCTHKDDGNGSHGEYWIEHEPTGDPVPGDALAGGKLVSNLSFFHDVGRDGVPELYIAGIHTSSGHRNDGVAESLMRRMHKDHPNTRINPGFMTDDGQAFHDKMLGKEPDARGVVTAGRMGDPPPMTFEPFNTMWSNGIMARHAEDGRPLGHLHWYPDGEIETIRVHPELRGRDIAKHMLMHAATNPDTYEAEGGIKPSNHLTPEGRAFAQSLGHNPSDDEVTPAEGENEWAWKAVQKYVPLHVPYTGQNEDEMSRYVEQPWTPPTKTASASDGWPVWWRGKHRPGVEFDKRWHPNHPDHIPAPWDN